MDHLGRQGLVGEGPLPRGRPVGVRGLGGPPASGGTRPTTASVSLRSSWSCSRYGKNHFPPGTHPGLPRPCRWICRRQGAWETSAATIKSSLALMPRADAASRKYEWENSVSRFCQVKNRFVEPHIDEASNIFPKHPTGPQLGNNAAHFRPQVAFIRKALPLSRGGEGLAGEAAGDDGDCFKSCFLKNASFVNVVMSRNLGTSGQCRSRTE